MCFCSDYTDADITVPTDIAASLHRVLNVNVVDKSSVHSMSTAVDRGVGEAAPAAAGRGRGRRRRERRLAPPGGWRCKFCSRTFESIHGLRGHVMTTHDYYCAWNGTVSKWSSRGFRDAELLKLKAGRSHNPSAIYVAAAATGAAPAAPVTNTDATADTGTATAAAAAHADTTKIDAGSGIRQVSSSTSLTGCEPVTMSDEDGQFLGRPETLDMTMRELLEYATVPGVPV